MMDENNFTMLSGYVPTLELDEVGGKLLHTIAVPRARTRRKKEIIDFIPLDLSEMTLDGKELIDGGLLAVAGKIQGDKNLLSVLVTDIITDQDFLKQGGFYNKVSLEGDIAEWGSYKDSDEKKNPVANLFLESDDSIIPVSAWDEMARTAAQFQQYDKVKIDGRFLTRDYSIERTDGIREIGLYYWVGVDEISCAK